MKDIILHILCEGQTEERFVKELLRPYFQPYAIYTKAVLLTTSRKKNARGGMLSYTQVKGDLTRLMKSYSDTEHQMHLFTTMFDLYALPDDFPGMESNPQDPYDRVGEIERLFGAEVSHRAFIPYIQLHEFEALLFTDIEKLCMDYPKAAKNISRLKKDCDRISAPELIDHGPDTAPSKRIIKALEGLYHYNKVASGASVCSLIGLDRIIEACPHFSGWIQSILDAADRLREG